MCMQMCVRGCVYVEVHVDVHGDVYVDIPASLTTAQTNPFFQLSSTHSPISSPPSISPLSPSPPHPRTPSPPHPPTPSPTHRPPSRSTQLFINTAKRGNAFLDGEGFAPVGEVVVGMEVVDKLYMGYGEGGRGLGEGTNTGGPSQGKMQEQGNAYLDKLYPKLSFIVSARIM